MSKISPTKMTKISRAHVRAIACAAVTTAAAACTGASAAGQSSANFTIPQDSINAGVAQMSSASFVLASSVGDAVATANLTSVGFQLASGFRAQVSTSQAMLNLLSVVSKKFHGATAFELVIDRSQPITGAVSVEPRAIGLGHTILFRFDKTVNSVTAASAMDAMMTAVGTANVTLSGNEAIVSLTGVPDNKRVTVRLSGLNGTQTASASMGFLVGDVNNSRSVTPSDVGSMKVRAGQTVNATNFQFDLNATGSISASDISAVKARAGQGLTLP